MILIKDLKIFQFQGSARIAETRETVSPWRGCTSVAEAFVLPLSGLTTAQGATMMHWLAIADLSHPNKRLHQLALGVAFHGISPARAEMQSIAGGSSDRELAMQCIAVFGEYLFVCSSISHCN